MTDLREAAQMALDALEQVQEADTAGATPKMVMEARKLYEPTITALRAALAQPEPEPVAWKRPVYMVEDGWDEFGFTDSSGGDVPLYTAPPQREWQGLTENDFAIWKEPAIGILRWAEAVLKERNK